MKLQLKICDNLPEAKRGLALAKKIFFNQSLENSDAYKDFLWFEDPTFHPNNLFLVLHEQQIAGLIRVIPRQIYFKQILLSGYCISSVCIDESFRGQGISSQLTHFVHRELSTRKAQFTYLIARRAVDHYYPRFGYIGLSSYEKIQINTLPANSGTKAEFSIGFLEDQISTYDHFYSDSYVNCSGRSQRSREFWLYSAKRTAHFPKLCFINCWLEGRLIGYAIASGSDLLEFAGDFRFSEAPWVYQFLSNFKIASMQIPQNHAVVILLQNSDITLTQRLCPYGGHMVKFFPENLPQPLSDGLRNDLTEIEKIGQLLDLRIPGYPSTLSAGSGFNLSYFDQL